MHGWAVTFRRSVWLARAVGNTVETLMYGWLDNPVDIDESLQVSQFTLVDHMQYDCAQNYTAGHLRHAAADYWAHSMRP